MSKQTRGVICTLLGGALWGLSGSCGQYLFTHYQFDSAFLTVIRLLFAGFTLTGVNLIANRKNCIGIWKSRKDALQLIIFALLGLMFSQYAYLTSIAYSNAATATVLQYVGPVMVMAYVCARAWKTPTRREGAAIVLAVLGTYLLATHGNPGAMVLSREGLVWGLLSALSLAFYTLLPAKILPRWGSMAVTGWGMLIGGVAMFVITKAWRFVLALDAAGYLALAGVVVLGTVLAYTLYLQGVSDCGAVKASMLSSVEPVSATLFSVFWLGVDFEAIDLIGFVMIIATVFLLAKGEKQE